MNAADPAVRPDAGMTLADLWHLLWSYKVVVMLGTVLGGVAGVIVALTMTPVYRAEVVVTEARDGNVSGGGASIVNQLSGLAGLAGIELAAGGNASREARAVLDSRYLVEAFVTRYQLLPVLFQNSDRKPTLWLGVRQFRDSVVSIHTDTRKGTTAVSMEWTDPALAARWANDFVALANELVRARALRDAKRNIAYLSDQVSRTSVVEVQRVMYNLIETETKTLMLANARAEYAFTVVDPAVAPELRERPKRTLIAILGAGVGFLGGALFALFHSAFQRPSPARRPPDATQSTFR